MADEATWRYDVFLCFRGPDTRYTFTGTLYDALRNARLRTFMDDGVLKRGDKIANTINQALESSRISIVVLSPDFASSTASLSDLFNVIQCRKKKNQLVLPIFYDVHNEDVRNQRRSFGRSMLKHEHSSPMVSQNVPKWRSALFQVSNISGKHFQSGSEHEYRLIEEIVTWVTKNVPRYDIFLSFNGKDTRYSFTGFLYNALCKSGFKTFMSDVNQFSQSTIQAIEKSRLSIIVFSVNYAHSSSCLDELLTILDCMNNKSQLVWPIFYKVEPSDLRHQRNSYGEAMTEHEKMLGKESQKVQNWKSALFEVANLKGWHLKFGYEYELIEKIVEMAIKI